MVNPERKPPFFALPELILQRASLTSHLVNKLAGSCWSLAIDPRCELLKRFQDMVLRLIHFALKIPTRTITSLIERLFGPYYLYL